jgi:hypothetical protein
MAQGHISLSESRCQRWRTGGTGGLTWPHGDGSIPGVVEQRPALAAIPAGGTSTSGDATLVPALAGATTAVGGGSRTRGHKGRGSRSSEDPDRRGMRGMSPRRRMSTSGSIVECRGKADAKIAMVSSSRTSSLRTAWKMGKAMVCLMRAFRWP